MLDTANLLLTFAGLNGALTCLTLWKISREEAKKGGKLEWNLNFLKTRKTPRRRTSRKKRPSAKTKKRSHRQAKPLKMQKGVDILPPQYNHPQTKTRIEEGPYLEGEWEVII